MNSTHFKLFLALLLLPSNAFAGHVEQDLHEGRTSRTLSLTSPFTKELFLSSFEKNRYSSEIPYIFCYNDNKFHSSSNFITQKFKQTAHALKHLQLLARKWAYSEHFTQEGSSENETLNIVFQAIDNEQALSRIKDLDERSVILEFYDEATFASKVDNFLKINDKYTQWWKLLDCSTPSILAIAEQLLITVSNDIKVIEGYLLMTC